MKRRRRKARFGRSVLADCVAAERERARASDVEVRFPIGVKPEGMGFRVSDEAAADDLYAKSNPAPTEAAARKASPIWTGVVMYFPDVWAQVAKVSVLGNEQHNPGQPLHWSRGKSTDQLDAAFRHMLDHGRGEALDTDGAYHLAKAIWRLCAELQLHLEKGTEGAP